jgi:uncharacterized protein
VDDSSFEWDPNKARSNFGKHGVTFELARSAFQDPAFVDLDDVDSNEDRFKRLCLFSSIVFVVTYTERGDTIRIISARRANKHEQGIYFGQQS